MFRLFLALATALRAMKADPASQRAVLAFVGGMITPCVMALACLLTGVLLACYTHVHRASIGLAAAA